MNGMVMNTKTALHTWAQRVPILRRSAGARQFVKFTLVGVTNTAWDFLIYVLLTRGWLGFSLHFLVANFLAFLVAVINSYCLNKRWTFRDTDRHYHIQFTKFFMVNLVTIVLYEFLLYVFVDHFGWYDLLAKLPAVVIITAWNFSANKFWTFRLRPLPKS